MSQSRRERGEYIRSKMHEFILYALGRGEINWEEAGYIYDLISGVMTAGTAGNKELAHHPFYLKAEQKWVEVEEMKRERLAAK